MSTNVCHLTILARGAMKSVERDQSMPGRTTARVDGRHNGTMKGANSNNVKPVGGVMYCVRMSTIASFAAYV